MLMLLHAWPELRVHLPQMHKRWLLAALIGMTISGYLAFEAFHVLFRQMKFDLYGRRYLAHLYFIAQLMKHLPGRIWGIAYQSTTASQVSLTEWVSINAMYMVLTMGFAVWVAATFTSLLFFGAIWGTFVFIAGVIGYVLGWHSRSTRTILSLLAKLPVQSFVRLSIALQPFSNASVVFKIRVMLFFSASWLLYLASWGGFGLAWPGLDAADGVYLCALYTAAWLVGYLSFLSPSGLGVRELAFVTLAHRFPADAVAGMAVFGRISLLAVDVVLALLFAPFKGNQVNEHANLPQFDDSGLNLVDPNDRRGLKTAYISLLQSMALASYVGRGTGSALDLGCGYGRMSGALRELGWDVVGVDPSQRVLSAAATIMPDSKWCVGRLPELPFAAESFNLVIAQNLLRVLHLNQALDVAKAIPNMVKPQGHFVVVDNIRSGHPDYVSEDWIISTFTEMNLRLVKRVAIRKARWWGIYAVRYGLVPSSLHEWLAAYELRRMEQVVRPPTAQYHNVLYVFEKLI
ncbi:methyltransferase domain-containing protein [Dyella silvatica]|uniref:methyltransferase domain-containing protein n=1 Tax=Dyella silvatica TaxID=2992128 RepID=UPI00224D127B|nr:methyltransferase domain-containing protein [Dyella silvatica]